MFLSSAATRDPPVFLGKIKNTGTVTIGKMADPLLVDGDPTVEIANTRRISEVMVRGKFFAEQDLDRMKSEVVERSAKE